MRQCTIISDINPTALQLVLELAKKNNQTELYLLSDAIFMLNDIQLDELFGKLHSQKVDIFVLEEDVEKRKPTLRERVSVISYDSFVNRLLSNNTQIINL